MNCSREEDSTTPTSSLNGNTSAPESEPNEVSIFNKNSVEHCLFDVVQDHVVQFECSKHEINRLWEYECCAYEQTIDLQVQTSKSVKSCNVPRRNYINRAGLVHDTFLFPYHPALYPLLDAYDCLYRQSKEEPVDEDSYRFCASYPFRDRQVDRDGDDEDMLCDYMPCTIQAVLETLVVARINWEKVSGDGLSVKDMFSTIMDDFFNLSRDTFIDTFIRLDLQNRSLPRSNDSNLERYWASTINDIPLRWQHYISQVSDNDSVDEAYPCVTNRRFGIEYLPITRIERSSLLLRLLRHSLSELQRDYKISIAVMLCLQRFHDLDDVSILRQLLAIVDEEYIECGFPCDSDPMPHRCCDWERMVLKPLRDLLGLGLTFITEGHVYCILGFVKHVYLRGFGPVVSRDIKIVATEMLKRVVGAGGSMDRIPVFLIVIIIRSIGSRASIELKRLENFRLELDNEVVNTAFCVESLRSYMNCLKLLVHIGEMTVQFLPENERFYPIASEIVKSLYYAVTLVEQVDEIFSDALPFSISSTYLGKSSRHFHQRLCSSLRFSDHVEYATEYHAEIPKKLKLQSHDSNREILKKHIDFIRRGRPPMQVKRIVKALFTKDLVDVRLAGMGYGDFLLWCRFDVTLEDPLMYRHDYQYPVEDDDSSDSFSSDESGTWDEWDCDSNAIISQEQARARYDFSLLCFARAWSAPWSPSNHMSFQPKMRQAIQTMAICAHRIDMPMEIHHRIASFLNRDWWPDDMSECWNSDCQISNIRRATDAYSEYVMTTGSEGNQQFADFLVSKPCATLKSCSKCNVAKYCSKRCKDFSYKVSHKRCCAKPPCCKGTSTFDEIQLYRDVEALRSIKMPFFIKCSESKDNDANMSDDDDNESWESMETETDDTNEIRTTDIIYKFFNKHSYNT